MSSRNLYIAEFDEIHVMAKNIFQEYRENKISKKEALEAIEDECIHAYLLGFKIAGEDLNFDEADMAYFQKELEKNPQKINDAVFKEIEGKNFEDRASEHLDNEKGEKMLNNMMDSEFHRNTSEGMDGFVQEIQKQKGRGRLHIDSPYAQSNEIMKVWETMKDDRVRDTHDYLEGMSIPYSQDFYTYNGNHAKLPGMFGVPEEDCGCRCIARLTWNGKQLQSENG